MYVERSGKPLAKYRSFNKRFDGHVRHSPFLPHTPAEQTAPLSTWPVTLSTSFQTLPPTPSGIRHCGNPGIRPVPPVHGSKVAGVTVVEVAGIATGVGMLTGVVVSTDAVTVTVSTRGDAVDVSEGIALGVGVGVLGDGTVTVPGTTHGFFTQTRNHFPTAASNPLFSAAYGSKFGVSI